MKKVTTCEGDTVDITGYDFGAFIEIPLKAIKEYEYSDILKRDIPIHFREVFERKVFYFIKDPSSEKIVFNVWSSKEIK